eukprot:Clim_evm13s158 gene=Clim_evmTU13s158
MCRFVIYTGKYPTLLGDLLTRPDHSIIKQSFDSKLRLQGSLNGDGFGLGWYDDAVNDEACIFTSVLPAWSNLNLRRLCDKIQSRLFFAHVRAATQGSPSSETNCHPWQSDKYLFMHNGEIANFQKIKRKVQASLREEFYDMIAGSTDSEHAFALHMQEIDNIEQSLLKQKSKKSGASGAHHHHHQHRDCLHRTISTSGGNSSNSSNSIVPQLAVREPSIVSAPTAGSVDLSAVGDAQSFKVPQAAGVKDREKSENWRIMALAMARVIKHTVALSEGSGTDHPSLLNFALSDGTSVVSSRYINSDKETPVSLFYSSGTRFEEYEKGKYHMLKSDRREQIVIIASEPLTYDRFDWLEVPKNHLVIVTHAMNVLVYSVEEVLAMDQEGMWFP